jgi:hypothetical protein
MSDPQPAPTLAAFRRVPIAAGAVVVLVGCLVLLSWATDVELLKRIAPSLLVMLPNPAVGFVLAGASLLLACVAPGRRWIARAARALGAAVLLLGLVSVGARLLGWDIRLDLLLFRGAVQGFLGRPAGEMASNSAVSFVLAGLGLVLLDVETRRGRHPAQLIGVATLLVAFLALVGYAFGVRQLYAVDRAVGMALLTALAFAALGLGIVFARPERGPAALVTGEDAVGILARRLLPAAIIVPVVSGWLLLRALQLRLVSFEWGVALFVVASVAVLVSRVLRAARTAHARDLERQAMLQREQVARAQVEAAHERLRQILSLVPAAVRVMVGPDHVIESVNAEHRRLFGDRDVVGKPVRDALPELGIRGRIGVCTGEVVTGTEERLATGDAVNLAIGQGYLVATPLQVCNMYAAIANGGRVDDTEFLSDDLAQGLIGNPKPWPDLNIVVPMPFHLGYHESPIPGLLKGFGHIGLGGTLGWADPASGSAFAFVHNRLLTPMVLDMASFAGLARPMRNAITAARHAGALTVPRYGARYRKATQKEPKKRLAGRR